MPILSAIQQVFKIVQIFLPKRTYLTVGFVDFIPSVPCQKSLSIHQVFSGAVCSSFALIYYTYRDLESRGIEAGRHLGFSINSVPDSSTPSFHTLRLHPLALIFGSYKFLSGFD